MEFDTVFRRQQIHPSVFLAAGVIVRGDVTIDEESSLWFNAVVRGDSERIHIGRQTNVQELCVLHADPGFPCLLGQRVTVGHAAIVHGARVEDDCLIGMRAVVMNGVHLGAGSLIAAGSVIPEGTVIPPNSLVMGTPGRVKRPLGEEDLARIRRAAAHYVQASRAFLRGSDECLSES